MTVRGGIDLGGTKIQAVVVDDDGAVLGRSRHPTPRTGGPPDVAAVMVDALVDAAHEAGVEAVIVGGGMGVRLGEPYVRRIEAAMTPHVFMDVRPPAVHVAALGDLGEAIGASLLVKTPERDRRARLPARSGPPAPAWAAAAYARPVG